MKILLILGMLASVQVDCQGMLSRIMPRVAAINQGRAFSTSLVHREKIYTKNFVFKNPHERIEYWEGDPNDYESWYGIKPSKYYRTYTTPIQEAVADRNPRKVEHLLFKHRVHPDTEVPGDFTILWDLLNAGDFQNPATIEIIELLLCAGANPNSSVKKKTCLHLAAQAPRNSKKVIEMLLLKGADPKARNAHGMTPLDVAAQAERWWNSPHALNSNNTKWENDPVIFVLLAGEFPVEKE